MNIALCGTLQADVLLQQLAGPTNEPMIE